MQIKVALPGIKEMDKRILCYAAGYANMSASSFLNLILLHIFVILHFCVTLFRNNLKKKKKTLLSKN